MKTILSLCLLLVPAAVAAQEGSVTYDHTVVFGFANPDAQPAQGDSAQSDSAQADSAQANGEGRGGEDARRGQAARGGAAVMRGRGGAISGFRMPEGMPTNSFASVVLRFNAYESVMAQAEETEEAEDAVAPSSEMDRHIVGMGARLRMMSPVRSDQETLIGAYSNITDGTLVQEFVFMGRTFRIKDMLPTYEWRLVAEQSDFMGYMVMKAETEYDGRTIEAWFTPQVPVAAGPGRFGGLPGLILVLSVNRGEELYSATSVDLGELDIVIAPPEDGDEISREEYEKIVEEKLEELRTTRSRARTHRIGRDR
jgi:GLPGLI family protein